ncbi:hypothetical protein CK203_111454 [Vitis vinifera]|uniref:Uncharacterized protein n=1 Tax=Vitis vinifera TaxID=29760 RepID=A0A438BP31_VITVI|nr:hypothetical protein CK203_111454 [Vitis vinifera]
MLKVLDAQGSYSCTTLRVACFDITMAILGEHTLELKSKLCYRNMASNITDHLHTGATPYFLVYGMKFVLLVKTEMGSLRVALE